MKSRLRQLWRAALLGALCVAVQGWIPASAQIQSLYKIADDSGILGFTLEDSDLFGFSTTSIGDLDNDGVPDIAVGVPRGDDGGTDRGGVWIFFLNVDNTVKSFAAISDTQGGFLGTIDSYDYFGISVCGIGDLNGDGTEDLVVGAGGDDDSTGSDRGAVYILFLNSNGTVDSFQKISDSWGNFAGILRDADFFGQSVANIGDFNGDGVTDIAVGAPGSDVAGNDNGAVWILMLQSNGNVLSYTKIDNSTPGFAGMLNDGDGFGHSIAPLGDMDGNGSMDLAVGALRDDDGGPDRGAFWSLFLNAGTQVDLAIKVSDLTGGMQGFLDDYDQFGCSVANIGDLDGDGVSDLAVGAFGDDDGGTNSGGFYILYMRTTGKAREVYKVPLDQAPFQGLVESGDYLGFSLGHASDINGDGVIDLLVGAIGDDGGSNGIERGATMVLHLGFRVPASVSSRNGTGVNRECLSHLTLPRLGTDFDASIDTTGHAGSILTFLVAYDSPLTFLTPLGELLVATEAFGGAHLFTNIVPASFGFGFHRLAVPNDVAFEGFQFSSQGMMYSSFIELCNALDLRIGY